MIANALRIHDRDTAGNVGIDTYAFPAQTTDISAGRCPDGGATWVFFSSSTPGAANGPCGETFYVYLLLVMR